NLLWDPERDEALLTDFGVSVRLAEAVAGAGTLPHIAPGAPAGRVAPAADVHSPAAALFPPATGEEPFPGPATPAPPRQIPRGLSESDPRCQGLPELIEGIIRAGLAAEPGRRPTLKGFVATLRGALNQLLADTLTMPVSPAALQSTTEPEPPARPAPVN